LGFKPYLYRQDKSVKVIVSGAPIARWLEANSGKLVHNKSIAPWVFELAAEQRNAVLQGMLFGDGYWSPVRRRWEYSTSLKSLALGVKFLAQSLGQIASVRHVGPKQSSISGRILSSKESWVVQITDPEGRRLSSVVDENLAWTPVREISPVGKRRVYDLEVEDDHSYVVEGLVVSNCHGVTRGVGGSFYDYTQPSSGWKVHHYPAMYRPTFTDEERDKKMKLYGSRDSPDFRRNVYGLHGDANSPLFVLHRLMENVDGDRSSDYNLDEYWFVNIDEGHIRENGPLAKLDIPGGHLNGGYKTFWIGMDVGFTLAPSAICVFAEVRNPKGTQLKLLSRIILKRVGVNDQITIVLYLMDKYRPAAFALDRTGVGLPLFQGIQDKARETPELKFAVDRIKGYNFAEKLPVEFDDNIKIDENDPKGYEAAIIKRNVLEYSSDVLRGLVDEKRLILPWDEDLIGEFRGQTWTYEKSPLDMYGRKKSYNQGSFHSLDACRMAALAWKQATIEEFLKSKQEDLMPPAETIFLDW
jgi:hypothetical protein